MNIPQIILIVALMYISFDLGFNYALYKIDRMLKHVLHEEDGDK